MSGFTHLNEKGEANMVDVTEKEVTGRMAVASGVIRVCDQVIEALTGGRREEMSGELPEEELRRDEGAVEKTAELRDEGAAEKTGQAQGKGDILGVARIAGIMAAKKTSELIPLCHPLLLTKIAVDFEVIPENNEIRCTSSVRLAGKTGAEMEALTAVSVALLTIYDMCKAVDKSMVISEVRLLEKDGGKSGHFLADR